MTDSTSPVTNGLEYPKRRSWKGPWRSAAAWTVLLLVLCGSLPAPLPIPQDQGMPGVGLSLRRLPNIGSLLYITAHPDDENNAVLIGVSRSMGVRTGLLTLTRGEGGQNEIGPELFEALGILRSEELMTVHRYDGAQQFFTRAYEFGFSFSVEETLEKWGRDEILRDIVRVIREYRPHVVVTLRPHGQGGGQHHQASAILGAEAFDLAGDEKAFPEQLAEGLRPWQPIRLFQAMAVGQGGGAPPGRSEEEPDAVIRVPLDVYDPLLGGTLAQMGALARRNHRSQGMNVLPNPGPAAAHFRLAKTTRQEPPGLGNFFDDLNVSLSSLAGPEPSLTPHLLRVQSQVDLANAAFVRADFRSVGRAVMNGLEAVRQALATVEDPETRFVLERQEMDFLEAAARAHFIHFDGLARRTSDGVVVPGEEFQVEVRFHPRSEEPITLERVTLKAPPGWEVEQERQTRYSTFFRVQVARDAESTRPHWFRSDPRVDRYDVRPGFTGTEPFPPPPLTARVEYLASDVPAWVEAPVEFQWFDAAFGGERRADLKVVPKLAVSVHPSVRVLRLPDQQEKTLQVRVRNNLPGPAQALARLKAPSGWNVSPREENVQLGAENEEIVVRFRLEAPAGLREGSYSVRAEVEMDGEIFDSGYQVIDYHHIRRRILTRLAEVTLQAVQLEFPDSLEVGYVMGVGDEVGKATEEMGARVTYLGEEDLAFGDLSRFDVIVTGVRAYLNRADLRAYNHRLLEYVRRGGRLIVQYNKYEFHDGPFAPYQARINRPHDRVTHENSAVRMLEPDHPFFHSPNPIGPRDWEGWVQERGLYFMGEWDAQYRPLLELQDPWPYNNDPKRGALLFAPHGEGTYVYTGLAFFRQLPEGVPGAYRLWANLLAASLRGRR